MAGNRPDPAGAGSGKLSDYCVAGIRLFPEKWPFPGSRIRQKGKKHSPFCLVRDRETPGSGGPDPGIRRADLGSSGPDPEGCPSQAPWAWLALVALDLDAIQHLPRIAWERSG